MKKSQEIIEQITAESPIGTRGGYLCKKDGQICLRMCDRIEALVQGGFHVTKMWLRPSPGEEWNKELYGEVRGDE